MSKDEQSPISTDARSRSRRLRMIVHCCSAFALLLIFAMGFTGWMSHIIMSNPYTVSPDPVWNALNEWRWIVLPFHRWGGILLVISLLICGTSALMLAKHSWGFPRRIQWLTAWLVLTLAPAAAILSHATGVLAGPTQFEARSEVSSIDQSDSNVLVQSVRTPTQTAAYDMHLGESLVGLGVAVLLLMAVSSAASAIGRQEARPPSKESAPARNPAETNKS